MAACTSPFQPSWLGSPECGSSALEKWSLKTFAILDDGAERTVLLPEAAQHLQLSGDQETLILPTVHTRLGWNLQGFEGLPTSHTRRQCNSAI